MRLIPKAFSILLKFLTEYIFGNFNNDIMKYKVI
jgi:hypothetical protein